MQNYTDQAVLFPATLPLFFSQKTFDVGDKCYNYSVSIALRFILIGKEKIYDDELQGTNNTRQRKLVTNKVYTRVN